jgi:hypothetical protein
MSRGVETFFFHPLTFRHRVNNFIGQQVYSPGGPKLTGEVGNGLFAAGFHGDFNFHMTNLILKNHGFGKVHVPVFPKNFLISCPSLSELLIPARMKVGLADGLIRYFRFRE